MYTLPFHSLETNSGATRFGFAPHLLLHPGLIARGLETGALVANSPPTFSTFTTSNYLFENMFKLIGFYQQSYSKSRAII